MRCEKSKKKVEFHVIIETKKNMNNKFNYVQIDSSTIDGNVVLATLRTPVF